MGLSMVPRSPCTRLRADPAGLCITQQPAYYMAAKTAPLEPHSHLSILSFTQYHTDSDPGVNHGRHRGRRKGGCSRVRILGRGLAGRTLNTLPTHLGHTAASPLQTIIRKGLSSEQSSATEADDFKTAYISIRPCHQDRPHGLPCSQCQISHLTTESKIDRLEHRLPHRAHPGHSLSLQHSWSAAQHTTTQQGSRRYEDHFGSIWTTA